MRGISDHTLLLYIKLPAPEWSIGNPKCHRLHLARDSKLLQQFSDRAGREHLHGAESVVVLCQFPFDDIKRE
jgi:hypothetical protein